MNEIPNNVDVTSVTPDAQSDAKVMQQHEINALVSGEKKKAYEKGKQEAAAEFAALSASRNTNNDSSNNTAIGINLADHEAKLRQIASEELAKQRSEEQQKWIAQQNEAAGNKILNDLTVKMSSAKEKFDDYDKVVHPNFGNFVKTPEVLLLAHQFDNSAEILYDLAKNPSKTVSLATMERMGMKAEAFSQMQRLSESIKVNENAAKMPKSKAPLSQVNPSVVGVGKTDGNVSSEDFRGMY